MGKLQTAPRSKKYDYVVIGSGSAGSVVASRLAEVPTNRVLLLEAGPSDQHIHIRMPAALGLPLGNDRFNWRFESEPEPGLGGRTVIEARGKVLGGSSSINGMNWVRGNPWDYDNWGAMGLEGWSYDEVLPYFRRAESFDKGANDYRGNSGPMRIETCAADGPLYNAFIQSAKQAGMVHVDDHNGFRQEGVHVTQRNVGNGVRWSTSQGYIHAQAERTNLDVVVGGRLLKVDFSNRRAVRAQIMAGGEQQAIDIDGEIILCAGALNSPQLLQLSGIGAADELRAHGIGVVADLPAVGRGLKDHVAAPVQYRATQDVSAARYLNGLGKFKIGAQWMLSKTGLGATNFFEVGVFMRTSPEFTVPNVQFEFVPMLGEMQHGSVKLENGFQYFFSLMRPRSEGRVWLRDADPLSAPRFVFNYFEDAGDRREAIDAVRAIRNVVSQAAWNPYRGEEVTPGAKVESDEEIMGFLREQAGTNYHPCCSCRMGTDEATSVVDAEARVHGFDNLRVVDASIMPEIVSGNLNAPVIMMAEKLSDVILGKAPLPAKPTPYFRPEAVPA